MFTKHGKPAERCHAHSHRGRKKKKPAPHTPWKYLMNCPLVRKCFGIVFFFFSFFVFNFFLELWTSLFPRIPKDIHGLRGTMGYVGFKPNKILRYSFARYVEWTDITMHSNDSSHGGCL